MRRLLYRSTSPNGSLQNRQFIPLLLLPVKPSMYSIFLIGILIRVMILVPKPTVAITFVADLIVPMTHFILLTPMRLFQHHDLDISTAIHQRILRFRFSARCPTLSTCPRLLFPYSQGIS